MTLCRCVMLAFFIRRRAKRTLRRSSAVKPFMNDILTEILVCVVRLRWTQMTWSAKEMNKRKNTDQVNIDYPHQNTRKRMVHLYSFFFSD